ncbi:MAG TPA: hypothetical protein EYH31_11450 [Anaerolineae bacterium]|nr:hypothetical protein [Anaerolineae bacterium]
MFEGIQTPVVGEDVTSVKGRGEWLPIRLSVDSVSELVLTQAQIAECIHSHGRPVLLHSCGNLCQVMDDIIEDVKIDAKHSFEDTFLPVTEAKRKYGDRIAILGGIDVDFLCRASEEQVREYVRKVIDICGPGGGYALGTGNSVANYIPVQNYLAMLDEGRHYGVYPLAG